MFASDDMVYNVTKEGIQSGGMKVNSILLKNGDPLGYSKKGGTITKMLGDGRASGLIYLQEHLDKRMNNDVSMSINDEPVPDSIYDKILGIDDEIREKQKRRKHKKKKT